jgi:hypothetical protein
MTMPMSQELCHRRIPPSLLPKPLVYHPVVILSQVLGLEHLLSCPNTTCSCEVRRWWMLPMKGRPHGRGGLCFLNFTLDLFLIRSIGNKMRTKKIRRIGLDSIVVVAPFNWLWSRSDFRVMVVPSTIAFNASPLITCREMLILVENCNTLIFVRK